MHIVVAALTTVYICVECKVALYYHHSQKEIAYTCLPRHMTFPGTVVKVSFHLGLNQVIEFFLTHSFGHIPFVSLKTAEC